MRKTAFAIALGSIAAVPGLAAAQGTSPHSVTGNMSIVSDYRFRGISQTFVQPAIQGGIDYSHSSGFYLGNWNSNVSGNSFADGTIEMDVYGGFKKAFGDVTLDVGLLQYLYPGAEAGGVKYDTLEAYIGASWKWFTLKYSITLDDYFGVADSDGSGYLDLSASYEIAPKLMLVAHVGSQEVKNAGALDYVDYKLGFTYDLNGWVLGATYIDTDVSDATYTFTNNAGDSEDLAKGTLVFSVTKSF
jgi:uncharacterized protein (TIGR02001 family)